MTAESEPGGSGFKERVAAAFDGLATRYDTARGGFFGSTSGLLTSAAGLEPGQRVLDVGCGAGACLLAAAAAVGPSGHVTGIDFAPRMVSRSAAAAAQMGLTNVTVLTGDAEDPPFPAGNFDRVLAGNVMFLLSDPGLAASRYLDLLRPGGVFAFSWNVAEDPAWVPVLAAVDCRAPGGGFSAFLRRPPFDSVAAMESLLRRCGFESIETTQGVAEARYADADAWWRVSWEQAPALFWSGIDAADLAAARAEATRILDGMRSPDSGGGLVRNLVFCCARAVKPRL